MRALEGAVYLHIIIIIIIVLIYTKYPWIAL